MGPVRRFPDGIALGSDGSFWVALLAPPLPAFQAVAPFRAGRWLAAWVLQLYRPKIPRFGMVVQVSALLPTGVCCRQCDHVGSRSTNARRVSVLDPLEALNLS